MKNLPPTIFYPRVARLGLASKNGFTLIRTDNIVRCESDGNYSIIHLRDGKKEIICRKLKELAVELARYDIIRVHHSHLVNLDFVYRYEGHKSRCLLLTNGESVNVSLSRHKELLECIHFL